MENAKKKEMTTYAKLGLYRTVKSVRRRNMEEEKGLHVFVGNPRSGRPWVKVLRAHYETAWKEIYLNVKQQKRPADLSEEKWLDLMRGQMEQEIYDALLVQTSDLEQLGDSFQKQHGRKMTHYEKERYGAALEKGGALQKPLDASNQRATQLRKHWAHSVMDKIRKAHNQQPARLQQAWASVVGTEAAMETCLEGVDRVRGAAYCRCMSAGRRFELSRQGDLAKRLSAVLGQEIKKIIFK